MDRLSGKLIVVRSAYVERVLFALAALALALILGHRVGQAAPTTDAHGEQAEGRERVGV